MSTHVHVIRTGTLVGNHTFLRATGWGALLRRRVDYEFPVYAFVLEHDEGLIAIDAGMTTAARLPFSQRRFVPRPLIRPEEEIGPQMRARGLDPRDVRRVVVTHLDWDHVGGIGHFPNAEVLVHRPEHEFAVTRMGRMRYQSTRWPEGFRPVLYDLDPEPHGPFEASRALTAAGDVRVVGLPGHSIAQVGVIAQGPERPLFFLADHVLREDWFCEDAAAGNLLGLGIFFREQALATSRRVLDYAASSGAALLPSHDDTVPARLASAALVAPAVLGGDDRRARRDAHGAAASGAQ